MKTTTINLPDGKIVFETENGGGTYSSTVYHKDVSACDTDGFDVAMEAMHSTLLALVAAGVNLDGPEVANAIQGVVDFIVNEYEY